MDIKDDVLKKVRKENFIKNICSDKEDLGMLISLALDVDPNYILEHLVVDGEITRSCDVGASIFKDLVVVKVSRFSKLMSNVPLVGRFYTVIYDNDGQVYNINIDLDSIFDYYYDSVLEDEFKFISDFAGVPLSRDRLKDISLICSCLNLLPYDEAIKILDSGVDSFRITVS